MKLKMTPFSKVTTPSLIGRVRGGSVLFLLLLFFSSCSSDTEDYDPYSNWKSRNEAWFKQIADSARHGGSEWLSYKSVLKSPNYQSGIMADSIFVHILHRGAGTFSPASSDTVRINFRGTLMPTRDASGNPLTTIFTQTYYQDFDPATAAPQKACLCRDWPKTPRAFPVQ